MCWRHPLALALWYCMLFKPSVSTTSTAPRRAARRWCLSPPKSRVYLLKDRDAIFKAVRTEDARKATSEVYIPKTGP